MIRKDMILCKLANTQPCHYAFHVQGQVQQRRFTVGDYYRMADSGILKPDARTELLDGQILDMSPIGPFHGGVVMRLNEIFSSASRGRWLVSPQNPIRLDDFSEPQPDLVLLRRGAAYTQHHPRPEDVFLVIEVSDTSLEYDRDQKLSFYARAAIPEVWLVNLAEMTIEIYREPSFAGYANRIDVRSGGHAIPQAFPDVQVDVQKLLER